MTGETNHFLSNEDWHTRNFPVFFSKLSIFSKQDKQGKYKQFQTKVYLTHLSYIHSF